MAPPGQAARGRGQALAALGGCLARGWLPLAPLRASGSFLQIRISGIFLDFSGNIDFSPFSAMHGQKQTETGTRH